MIGSGTSSHGRRGTRSPLLVGAGLVVAAITAAAVTHGGGGDGVPAAVVSASATSATATGTPATSGFSTGSPSLSPSVSRSGGDPAPVITPTSSPTPSVPEVDAKVGGATLVLKDGHYGPLVVGMRWKDVVRSGWVRRDPNFEAKLKDLAAGGDAGGDMHCPGFFEDRYANGAVWVSDDRGIESLMFSRGVRTDRGVAIGTPWEEMLRLYHHPKIDHIYGRAVVPLGRGVILWFEAKEGPHGREVGTITISRTDQGCYE